jgi:beta-galactosidase
VTQQSAVPNPSVGHRDGVFLIDGKPSFIYSGEMHFFRILPEQWADRLLKMRRCYLNTMGAYLAWNWHEPEPGQFDFSGTKNLDRFLAQAEEAGLKVFIRPGPFICAEWDYGGLPAWLMKEGCEVRTTEETYLGFVRRWYRNVNPILRKHLHTQGGGVILYQIENEDWWSDVPYALRLLDMVREDGIDVPITTNENPGVRGTEIIDTLDDYPLPWHPNHPYMFVPEGVEYKLEKLRRTQPDKPMMYAEFECGWFALLGDDLPSCRIGEIPPAWMDALTKTVIGMGINALNNYMFCGGTNFAYTQARPNISSHDWMAPVGEWGQLSPGYYVLRRIGGFIETLGPQLAVCQPRYDLMEGEGEEITVFKRVGERSAFLFPRNIGAASVARHFQITLPESGESLIFPRHGAYDLAAHSAAILPVHVELSPDGPTLLYSTSQLFRVCGNQDEVVVILYERPGFAGEVVLALDPSDTNVDISGPARHEWLDRGRLCLNFIHQEATQIVRVYGKRPVALILTTPDKAGRTWEVPWEDGSLPLISNLYLLRDVEVADGRVVAEVDVEPDAAVKIEFACSQAPRRVLLDGEEIPARYDPANGLSRFGWSETAAPVVDQDLSGLWKVKRESLPSLDDPAWKPYQPWASAEQSGYYHNGYLWYGTTFQAPAGDGPLHLLLTRYQDDATVYINGQYAGSGNQHLELEVSERVRSGEPNTLLICVEVQGRDAWVAGDDHTGLIGPVLLYRERESIPLTFWKRREMPRCEEFSLGTPPPQALPEYDDAEWDDCLIEPGWDSQIHGRWRAKHFLWYRTKVNVPAEWDGKKIWLEVGRAQDTTWVYVDGKLAGKVTMFRRQGRGEFGVDLTGYVRPGQEVTLSCCVLGKWVGRKGFYQYVRLCAADDLLKDPWLIRDQLEGQREGMARPDYDDAAWPETSVPGSIVAEGAAGGVFWLRKKFEWATLADWEIPVGLALDGLSCKALVYLNGHLVGRYSPAGPQTVFHLPAPWLRQHNQLALALDNGGRPCQMGSVAIVARFPVRRRRLEFDLGGL